jgi:UrcA family protein
MKMIQVMGIATVVLAAGLAQAESPGMKQPQSVSTTVSFSRAEMQTLQGAQGLYMKLRSAAEEVCSEVTAPEGVSSMEHRACVSAALDGAVRDANLPLLSLLHGNRGAVVAMNAR